MNIENYGIRKNFLNYLNYLSRVSPVLLERSEVINNSKLKSAASRVNVPRAFDPYMKYIEKATKKPFPKGLSFTVNEVRKEDENIIKQFSQPTLSLKGINVSYLIQSALHVSRQMALVPGSIVPMSAEQSALRYPNNTSAGFPFFKRKDNDLCRSDAIDFAERHFEEPKFFKIMSQPAAVFHRFQYRVFRKDGAFDIKKKIRPVWGLPYRISVLEGMVFRNLLDTYEIKTRNATVPVSSIGRTKKQVSTDIVGRLRKFNKPIVSVDYSKFDSTVPSFMWALFYSVVKDVSNASSVSDELLDVLLCYHCYTPYCWNSTKIRYQMRGVPSGSLITSYFDTWVNRVIYYYSCLESKNGRSFDEITAFTLGDDLIFIEKYTTLNHLISVTKRFSMLIERDSCSIQTEKDEIDFLGYFWDVENRPTQKQEWYIAHLVLPSRFLKSTSIPLDVLQTYRGITICMSLYQGMEMFEYLVGHSDYIWRDLMHRYENGEDPIINYVGEDQRNAFLRIPLSVIFNEGWESL